MRFLVPLLRVLVRNLRIDSFVGFLHLEQVFLVLGFYLKVPSFLIHCCLEALSFVIRSWRLCHLFILFDLAKLKVIFRSLLLHVRPNDHVPCVLFNLNLSQISIDLFYLLDVDYLTKLILAYFQVLIDPG